MTLLIAGCQSSPQKAPPSSISLGLLNAKKAFALGEIYLAKRQTELFLRENPASREGQQLMGQILNEEIAQHKEAFDSRSDDELSQSDKKAKIKTLLERSRSLLEMEEFDEAAQMAEMVFTYDAENRDASRLLDQITQRAWTVGKKEIADGQEIVKAEVDDRTLIYRRQAQGYMEEGQWGAAQMSIQKLLLLSPEDKEGLRMLGDIKSKQRRNIVSSAKS